MGLKKLSLMDQKKTKRGRPKKIRHGRIHKIRSDVDMVLDERLESGSPNSDIVRRMELGMGRPELARSVSGRPELEECRGADDQELNGRSDLDLMIRVSQFLFLVL